MKRGTGCASKTGRDKVNGSDTVQRTTVRRPPSPPPYPFNQRKEMLALQVRDTRRS